MNTVEEYLALEIRSKIKELQHEVRNYDDLKIRGRSAESELEEAVCILEDIYKAIREFHEAPASTEVAS